MKKSNTSVLLGKASLLVLAISAFFVAFSLTACQSSVGGEQSSSSSSSSSDQSSSSVEAAPSDNGSTSSSVQTDKPQDRDVLDEATKQKYADQLAEFEARRSKIERDFDSDPRQAGNMAEMRQMSADYAKSLETLMNEICEFVGTLPGMDANTIAKEQEAWEQSWQNQADQKNAEFAEGQPYSGNSFGMQMNGEHSVYVNARIDELLDKAYAAIGVERNEQSEKTEDSANQAAPSYVVRFNTADGSFACDGIDIPQSISAYREKYGDDSAELRGPRWVASIPKTDLVVSYADGAPSQEIVSIEGPLGQIVLGIPEDEAIPLKDFVESLSAYNGTFDLTKSMSRSGASAAPCGNCYLLGGSRALEDESYTGNVCVAFADEDVAEDEYFDQQSRSLYIDVENGSVSAQSNTTLSVGVQ